MLDMSLGMNYCLGISSKGKRKVILQWRYIRGGMANIINWDKMMIETKLSLKELPYCKS